ncbi:MAG: UDP-N-acetylmuramoyl-L-alanine--D-glutamate ligase [Actinomycetaceae bacterium]|nr:UDP-N-acetylmuramoyl-L-alanine--D-glutamate ligase [Actinomycetaceae bacterium]
MTASWLAGEIAVIGLGKSGRAALDVLRELGAQPDGYDRKLPTTGDRADGIFIGSDSEQVKRIRERHYDLAILSPGVPPHSPVWKQLRDKGVPVWGEVELAWRVQQHLEKNIDWLTVTGTNGKTTTVSLLGSMLAAADKKYGVVGNVGTPIINVVAHDDVDVLAVELSSFQLETTMSVEPLAAVCLNVDSDHLDWHGSADAYARAKARVYENTRIAAVYDASEPSIEKMVAEADVIEGARAIGYTLGIPPIAHLGIVDNHFVDRAFISHRHRQALALATVDDMMSYAGAHPSVALVKDTLAAMTLARAYGVEADAIAEGMRQFTPAAHRRHILGAVADMVWIDDSKATNTHAAAASLAGFPPRSVIWVAGGDAKGQDFHSLVQTIEPVLRGVVVIGADPTPIVKALSARAPDVPFVVVDGHDDFMYSVVNEAVALSRPGDTVVLAPACASWDQFENYGQRGTAFAEAVDRLRQAWMGGGDA